MTFINPLDLKTLLVNNLAGNYAIFVGIAVIFIAAVAAKFRMTNIALWLMLGVFGGFIGYWVGWYWAVVIFVGALAIGFVIAKIIKQ